MPESEIAVTVLVENIYEDGDTATMTTTITASAYPADEEGREEWAEEYLYPLTGTYRSGNAGYFVTVVAADDPALHGAKFEWIG